jgi:hypothetical protein
MCGQLGAQQNVPRSRYMRSITLADLRLDYDGSILAAGEML